jgi:hypothetical protein
LFFKNIKKTNHNDEKERKKKIKKKDAFYNFSKFTHENCFMYISFSFLFGDSNPHFTSKIHSVYCNQTQPNISDNKLIELTRLKKYIILIFFRIQTISIFKNYIEY